MQSGNKDLFGSLYITGIKQSLTQQPTPTELNKIVAAILLFVVFISVFLVRIMMYYIIPIFSKKPAETRTWVLFLEALLMGISVASILIGGFYLAKKYAK
jgi:hypothetical protein